MEKKEYCVYVHTCPDGMQYFGMTNDIKRRWVPSRYKQMSLKLYIDKYGWENIKHEVIATDLTRDEALKLEDELICKARENDTCINDRRSGHYKQTDAYREWHNALNNAWRESHKEEYNARTKVHMREYRKRKKQQNEKDINNSNHSTNPRKLF